MSPSPFEMSPSPFEQPAPGGQRPMWWRSRFLTSGTLSTRKLNQRLRTPVNTNTPNTAMTTMNATVI